MGTVPFFRFLIHFFYKKKGDGKAMEKNMSPAKQFAQHFFFLEKRKPVLKEKMPLKKGKKDVVRIHERAEQHVLSLKKKELVLRKKGGKAKVK